MLRCLLGTTAATEAATAAAFTTGIQHLHVIGDDFGAVAVVAVLILPLARLQTTFDIEARAFLDVLLSDFRQLVEHHHTVPFGTFLTLTALTVIPGIRGGEVEVAHRTTGRSETDFRILTEITDQNDLVYAASHEDYS